MSDVFELRAAVDAARLQLESARAQADSRELAVRLLAEEVDGGAAPPQGFHPWTPGEWLQMRRDEQEQRVQRVAELERQLADATTRLREELARRRPLFERDGDDPIVLLPVRLETRFADERTIQVRVYPDDVHLDALDRRLTRAELDAAREYWRAPGEPAWQLLLTRLSPARAAWATRVTRPGMATPELRRAGERRPPETSTLPTQWRFLGLVGGRVVVDVSGRPVRLPLPLGLLVPEDAPRADAERAAWPVDFDAAVDAGMAVTLTLPDGVDHLDELFAIGVQRSTAAVASKRLRDTLAGHAFGAGLGFLSAGTPTNNTPESRSAWSSRPRPRRPGARAPTVAPGSDAARLASALGLPQPGFLADCDGAGDTTEQVLAALTRLGAPALTASFVGATGDGVDARPSGLAPWRAARDHLTAYVRSRGPLPAIRVGSQPYGILPVTSLDEWEARLAQGPTEAIVPWLLRLRPHWRAALAPGWVPRVSDGQPPDRTLVDVLSRLPVAVDVALRRLRAPATARERLVATWRGFQQRDPKYDAPTPATAVGGIAPDAALRWAQPTEQTRRLSFPQSAAGPDPAHVATQLDPRPGAFQPVLAASRELLADAVAVANGRLTPAAYARRWPLSVEGAPDAGRRRDTIFKLADRAAHPGLLPALLDPANTEAWSSDAESGASDPLRAALTLPQTVDVLVFMETSPLAGGDAQLRRQLRDAARAAARSADPVLDALATLAEAPQERLPALALELLDVCSHRLDAWITSLATRRLLAARETGGAAASRLGGYGWVENLRRQDEQRKADGWIHAPSLHHAATAAVLRSGFLAHRGDETFAVDLRSRRARVARWLLGGVRRGQELGALLGYRFERSLHEHGADALVDDFRRDYPPPAAPEPQDGAEQPDSWGESAAAVAARAVVDGLALARDADNAVRRFPQVREQVEALVEALDAVSDLLLAESVHQLVGGNPMRAGLAADTLGRGEDLPDQFDVLRTPHRGRALTHRIAVVTAAAPARPAGWERDALSALDPRVDAWVADALGPAAACRVTGTVRGADGDERRFDVGADQLGFGALTTALTVAGLDRGPLDARIAALEGADGVVTYAGAGWGELRAVATRVRSLLASAVPLLPRHLAAGPEPTGVTADMTELRARLARYAATLPGHQDKTTRAGRLAELAKSDAPAARWLNGVAEALAEQLGARIPLTPLLDGAALGPAPAGGSGAPVAAWLHRTGTVRPAVRGWHELLTLTGARAGAPRELRASQSPLTPGARDGRHADPWIGGPFPAASRPPARQQLTCHLPAPLPAGAPLAGIVFDEWVELLPGTDALAGPVAEGPGDEAVPPESELTGLTFHFDRPDAQAPQAILVAVPPSPRRGWTADGLALVVRDTLELAKLRAVDLGDLPLLDDLLPGVRLTGGPSGSDGLTDFAVGQWEGLAG
jgi:hypothetical protein